MIAMNDAPRQPSFAWVVAALSVGQVLTLGGAVLRLFVVRAADARRPALERGHADGRVQRRAGGLGRRLVRGGRGDRPRPRPGSADWRRRVGCARPVRVGGGARTVDVLRGVGRARRVDGDDAVRPRLHRADQALSAALPAGHHRAHAGRRLRQHAVVSGGGLADAVARLARHVGWRWASRCSSSWCRCICGRCAGRATKRPRRHARARRQTPRCPRRCAIARSGCWRWPSRCMPSRRLRCGRT